MKKPVVFIFVLLCICAVSDAAYGGGTGVMATNQLWINAVIYTSEKGLIDAVWQKGGEDKTDGGDEAMWGYFYASPDDVSWGSPDNPDIFVKIWFDRSGRIDVNYFHVSVPDIKVYADYPYDGIPGEIATTTTSRRHVRFYYQNGKGFSEAHDEDGNPPKGITAKGNPAGYFTGSNLRIAAVINTEEKGVIDARWYKGGEALTAGGHQVMWGFFYADPKDVLWGSKNNPELFVKIWFDASGRIDVNYFHVSVPDIEVYSDYPENDAYDKKGVTILSNRYIRHEFKEELDNDGDGYTESQGDCDDANAGVQPGAVEICGDGIDQDCSGADRECHPNDIDNDKDGFTENKGDCNDDNRDIHPEATDLCGDGIDQDCNNGDAPCGPAAGESDQDGDGFTANQGDCNDDNASIHPAATEICGDSIDQDCDGSDAVCTEETDKDRDGYSVEKGDCNDNKARIHPGAAEICGDGIDQDCDGFDLACVTNLYDIDDDYDGYTENWGDCNDYESSIHPYSAEICGDGIDQNCDGVDLSCMLPTDTDKDYDGFTANQGDCNDNNASIHPGAAEICGDSTDQDCSGFDLSCTPSTGTDKDNDGFTAEKSDCNDNDASIHPGATEICGDGTDQDCDGKDTACVPPPETDSDKDGYTISDGDCNDTNAAVHPDAEEEICGDRVDQNCDGYDCARTPTDNDGDGYSVKVNDCNDSDGSVYPGAAEICGDGIDQNCDGKDLPCGE
ncbi:MAG: hypothetical protein BWK80_36745 [Desulfobacteraceae bacterium IS3]|nr:MAG: hypothetical protein BWK80_36745 [Desulfobacteraceae bacterium IS3]